MSANAQASEWHGPHFAPGRPAEESAPPSSFAALLPLCAIARFHQVAADPATLAHRLGLHASEPIGITELLRAAKHLGLKAKHSTGTPERLQLIPLPALAEVHRADGSTGFVILAQCDGQRVLFQDPTASGSRPTIEATEVFARQWTGQLILIASRASLAGELAKFDFSWFIPALVKYRKLLGEVLLISLMLQLFALVSPLFFQVVMDKVLVHRGMTTLDVLVIGLVVVVLFESALNGLRSYVFSHTTNRIDVELGSRLFRHLVQLPLAYFQARRVGDSVARVRELENIRSFLTGSAMTVVLDLLFSVVFIAVMMFYNVPLTLIVLVSLPLYFSLSLAVVPILRKRLNVKFARGAENQAMLVETVTGIQTVKAGALEPSFARRWDNQLAAYIVSDVGDVAIELAGEGTDSVQSSVAFTLVANLENLTLTGTEALSGIGNDGNNVIVANAAGDVLQGMGGNDTLRGGAGADTLFGGDGNDRLDGGVGADKMAGGAGNDTYIVDDVGDQITELASEGADSVESAISYTLGANLENLTLTGTGSLLGVGNELANLIVGSASSDVIRGLGGNDTLRGGLGNDTLEGGDGDDRLDGGAGSDQMTGGAGNDTYVVDAAGDVVIELANEGVDTVQSSISYSLGAALENLTLTGAGVLVGQGNAAANVLTANGSGNSLSGLAGDDTLLGGAGSDTLFGGDGNDRLDGKGGADQMTGGAGNDVYVVNAAGDLVVELDGEGADTVQSSISYTLTTNVENLTLTGTAAINGTGNELNNTIIGNGAANRLRGLGGNDTLNGGAANDTLEGGTGDDRLNGGLGADTYLFGRGDGQDTLVDVDATAGVQDVLRFGTGIAADQLWLRKVGSNLEISVIGTTDKVTISGWYADAAHHVEVMELANGKQLLDSQVQNLVQAMAAFAPPAAGQTTLSTSYHSSLDGVIAANWQ